MNTFRVGKLNANLLGELLCAVKNKDPIVVVGPKVGEDAAVIDFGDKYLIATTDPITFTSYKIGWYMVNVNANDIATMGGTPKWLLASIFLPENKTDSKLVEEIFHLRPKVDNVNLLQRESSQMRTEKDALESMSTRNPSILQLLRELTLVIPASAWLTDTNFNGRELVIGGYAQSSLELIGLLEESPRFSNVEFRGTITKRNNKERFKISAQIE